MNTIQKLLATWSSLKQLRDFANSMLGQLVLWAGGSTMAAAILNLIGPIVSVFAEAAKIVLDILGALVRSYWGRTFLFVVALTLAAFYGKFYFEQQAKAAQLAADQAQILAVAKEADAAKTALAKCRPIRK